MAVILKCPACEKKFRWDFAAEDKWPKACPMCGERMDEGMEDDVIRMPSLRSPKTDVVDTTYRQIEQASEVRMEQAAQMAGTSVADMSSLKITDLKTGVQPGESYVPEVRNAVTERMDQMQARGAQVGFSGAQGAEYAGMVRSGPHPNAGAKTLSAIQKLTGRGG